MLFILVPLLVLITAALLVLALLTPTTTENRVEPVEPPPDRGDAMSPAGAVPVR
ncbi:hypothetical protein [Allonocardiopsis opalescens]|nr:hypothetical protein [Allonocardiopsis opalescens]